MITTFKIFEQINQNEPEIGDYVLCRDLSLSFKEKVSDFIENNIGQCIKVNENLLISYNIKIYHLT